MKINQNTLVYRSGIRVRGVIPKRQRVQTIDGKFMAYREVAYPKSEILIERKRLEKSKDRKLTLDPVKFEQERIVKKKAERLEKRLKELPRFSLTYIPFVIREESSEVISIPLRFDYFVWKYLSLGIYFSYDNDVLDDEKNTGTNPKPRRERTTTESVVDIKVYPLRLKSFEIGVGIERYSITETMTKGEVEFEETVYEKSSEGWGKNITLRVNLSHRTKDSWGKSLYLEHREYDESKAVAIGFGFQF